MRTGKQFDAGSNAIYFFNELTGESVWERPSETASV